MANPPISRQQRRKVKRDAIERGRKILARGLGTDFNEDEALGIALVLYERLTDESRPRRAAEAAEIAEQLLDKSLLADTAAHDIGCRKGCSFCCVSVVTCTPPEIFRVAHWLTDNANGAACRIDIAEVAAEAARRQALPGTELFTNRKHCPLLVAQACGVYAVRPIPCRALLSLSSQACQLALEENKGQVPVIATAMNKGEMVRTMLLAAVSAAGLADRGIELNAGVTTAMNMPDAEARWLAGENIFDGVLGAERMLSSRGAQDHIAKLIRVLVD